MKSRRAIRPPDLTSLFDVLFLFVFVSLVNAGISRRAADVAQAAAATPPRAPAPAPAPSGPMHDRAIAQLGTRPEAVVRVTAAGVISSIEFADHTIASDVSLVERVADPDVGLAYRGDRDRALRVCGVVARGLDAMELHGMLVVIAPAAPTPSLPHALVDGLRADETRCAADTGGIAVIVEPTKAGGP